MYAIHLNTGEVESFTNYNEALERFANLLDSKQKAAFNTKSM